MIYLQPTAKRHPASVLEKKAQYLRSIQMPLLPILIVQHYWMISSTMRKRRIRKIKAFHFQLEDKT